MRLNHWSAGTILIALLFSSTAVAQSETWQECSSFVRSQNNRQLLKDLFTYAQIVERPKHKNNDYMEVCQISDGIYVNAPKAIRPLILTPRAIRRINSNIVENQGDRAYVLDEIGRNGLVSVGCKGKDGRTKLPLIVSIGAYFNLIGDFLDLNISFSAEIRQNDSNGNITRVFWAPYYDEEKKEIIHGIPGTDVTDIQQIIANYVGDECVFPAMRLTLTSICDMARDLPNEAKRVGHHSELANFKIDAKEFESIKAAKHRSVVLTGHSLGGQAVQYVTATLLQGCPSAGTSFRAFAFASTRNPSENRNQDRHDNINQFKLESYLMKGDLVLEQLELGRGQTGRVTRYDPSKFQWRDRHRIDQIQNSICICLKGNGRILSQ